MEKIVNGTFTSVWDDCLEVTTACRVNTETREVFDIEVVRDVGDGLECCEGEFVTFNGERHEVAPSGIDAEYWYD